MSDYQNDPTWWQASDGKWYPPQEPTGVPAPPAPWDQSQQGVAQQQYPQAQYAQYQQPGHQTASGLPSVNGLAVASMVLGIVSLVFCWCWYIGGVCALVGLPLGAVALSKISKGQADPGPKGMAVAGLVMNIISLALIVVFVIVIYSAADSPSWVEWTN